MVVFLEFDLNCCSLQLFCGVLALQSRSSSIATAWFFTTIVHSADYPIYLDCGKKLCGSLDGLFNIYQRAMIGEGTFKVSAEDSLHLVEALRYFCLLENLLGYPRYRKSLILFFLTFFCSVVITELPSDHAKKALEVLCLPAVTPLQVSFTCEAKIEFQFYRIICHLLCSKTRKLLIKVLWYWGKQQLVS